MLRTLFKEYGFYLKVSKDFDLRHNVNDLNFREAILATLWKMDRKGIKTQSWGASKGLPQKLRRKIIIWDGIGAVRACGEDGVSSERCSRGRMLGFQDLITSWILGSRRENGEQLLCF